MTERIYSTDSYAREMSATVRQIDSDDGRLLLDGTVFYPGGGGQPCDEGEVRIGDDRLSVSRVTQDSSGVWHWIDGSLPPVGTALTGHVDWARRYQLMRTHTAMHALCGVIWERFQSPVTGGNMNPGEGRLDFELPQWDPEDKASVESELNRQLALNRSVEISFLDRAKADEDPSLIRTKVNLLPPTLKEVRVIDIVGLDRQADGGTHVSGTDEVGQIRIKKVESKGKGFRRIRVELLGTGVD